MKTNTPLLLAIMGFLLISITLKAQLSGSFTDSRDQKVYNYVQVGDAVWMTENLAFKADEGCYAYRNNDTNVAQNGYLYTWDVAIQVCPSGWHLPTDEEWQALEQYLGLEEKLLTVKGFRSDADLYSSILTGGNAGINLSLSGWTVNGKKFYHLNKRGSYWTASIHRSNEGWYRYIDNHKGIFRLYERKTFAYSVRCVKDNPQISSINQGSFSNKNTSVAANKTAKAGVVKTSQTTREFNTTQVDNREKDETAPEISIVSPVLKRGSAPETTEKTMRIKGKVHDKSGIFEVYVGNYEAVVAADGSFEAVVPLAYGENDIVVRATDLSFNTARKTVKITRKAGALVSPIPVTTAGAGASNGAAIEWRKPLTDELSTSEKVYNLNVCVKTKEKIEEVSIFVNDKLVKEFRTNEIVFRGECDFIIDEMIDLQNGQNEILISVNTDKNNYKETRVINYRFIQAKYYALVISVQDYDYIADLSNPISDGQKLIDILVKEYTFEPENIIFLKNPTKAEIISTLHKMRSYISTEDNLLIFYAGHGYWDEGMKVGYWLPRDSEQDNPVNWFSNTDLTNYLSAIKTKHTLLIADACFSGGIFKTRKAFNEKQVIERLYQLPSRKAITSGTLKEVPDESVFIEFLLKRLQSNKNKYMTTEELFSSLRTAVMNNSSNIPQFGTIKNTGDEGGDFIFIRR